MEGPVGKVRREEVHRGGSAYYKLRREEETLKGYTTLKCNTRSQNLGLILEHRSALERREKRKSKSHTMIAYVSSFSPALLRKSSEGRDPPPPPQEKVTLHPLASFFLCHFKWYYSDWGEQELTYGCRKPPAREAESASRLWSPGETYLCLCGMSFKCPVQSGLTR